MRSTLVRKPLAAVCAAAVVAAPGVHVPYEGDSQGIE
jgi:hypothetical protein